MPTKDELAQKYGAGWTASNPVPKLDADGTPVPNQYTISLSGPNGAQRIVTAYAPTPPGPTQFPTTDPERLATMDFTEVGVEETIKPPTTTAAETNENIARAVAERAQAEARAAEAAIALKKANEDAREAAYNQAQGNGYLTHEQLQKQRADAASQNLNADQVAVQRSAMENNNLNTIVSNQIASQNAATAAANAASQSRATEAQIRHVETGEGLDQAKFEWQKAQGEIEQQNNTRDAQLKELTQQQQNQVQVQQNAIRGQELAQRAASEAASLEQRKAEAAQTSQSQLQTAATSAAANVFGTERQAQTAAGTLGGNLLSNRATAANNLLQNILSGAGGLSQGSAGRFGQLGGGLQASSDISGLGPMLASGIANTTAQQFGGQATLDAAARMVRGAAPGAEMTPFGQAAIGVLNQVFERVGQRTGVPAAPVAAQQAAQATQQNNVYTAPVTTTPQVQAAQQSAAASPLPPSPMTAPQQGMASLFPNGWTAPTTIAPIPAINNLAPYQRGQVYG